MGCQGIYISYHDNNSIKEIIGLCEGNTLRPFNEKIYRDNNIQPSIEELPSEKEYHSKNEVSPILMALKYWKEGKQLDEMAIYRLQQFGFIHFDNKGILRITKSGEQALKDNNL